MHKSGMMNWKAGRKSDLQESKWTQPTDCLVLWAVELIEEQSFNSAGTEPKLENTVHRAEEVTANAVSTIAGL